MRTVYTSGYCSNHSDPHIHMVTLENSRNLLVNLLRETGANCIAVRGTSGLSMAYGMRMLDMLKNRKLLPFVMVRKDDGHHGSPVESLDFRTQKIGDYLILDDFISSGNTINRIIEKMEIDRDDTDVTCRGVVLYSRALEPKHSFQVTEHKFMPYETERYLKVWK